MELTAELAAALDALVAVRTEIAEEREGSRHLQGPRPILWDLNRLDYAISAVVKAYQAPHEDRGTGHVQDRAGVGMHKGTAEPI